MNGKCTNPDDVYFIPADDGWSLDGYFAAVPNFHGEVRFRYRPLTPSERMYLTGKLQSLSGSAAADYHSETLAKRIVWWSLDQPVSTESVSRLRYHLWDRLTAVVIYQSEAGDSDPEWSQEEKEFHRSAEIEASITGKSPVAAKVEALAKN